MDQGQISTEYAALLEAFERLRAGIRSDLRRGFDMLAEELALTVEASSDPDLALAMARAEEQAICVDGGAAR